MNIQELLIAIRDLEVAEGRNFELYKKYKMDPVMGEFYLDLSNLITAKRLELNRRYEGACKAMAEMRV